MDQQRDEKLESSAAGNGSNGTSTRGWGAPRAHAGGGGSNGGPTPPRQLPDPGGWGAPIELQPGIHYKAYSLPPGYVPAYPVPPGQGDESQNIGPGLMEYWRLLQRCKGTVLLIAALGWIAGILITLPMTPIYSAHVTLEIQETNPTFLNMHNVQQFSNDSGPWGLMTDIQTHIRILQSAALMDRVMEKFKDDKPSQQAAEPARVSAWRRARSRCRRSRSGCSPAGSPLRIATMPGPCDWPEVTKESAIGADRVSRGRTGPRRTGVARFDLTASLRYQIGRAHV